MNICTCVLYHEVLVCMTFVKHVNRHNTRRVYKAHECGCTFIRIHTADSHIVNRDPLKFFTLLISVSLNSLEFRLVAAVSFSRKDVVTELIYKFLFAAVSSARESRNNGRMAFPMRCISKHYYNSAISDRRLSYGTSRSHGTRSFITHSSLDEAVRFFVSHLHRGSPYRANKFYPHLALNV